MRSTFFFLSAMFIISLSAKSQALMPQDTYSGIWTEKQNGVSSIQWLFEGNGEFAEIAYWANGYELGGLAKKGRYVVDSLNHTVTLNFLSTMNIKDNSITKDENNSVQWKILSVNNDEMVISRGPSANITLVRLTKPQKVVAIK